MLLPQLASFRLVKVVVGKGMYVGKMRK